MRRSGDKRKQTRQVVCDFEWAEWARLRAKGKRGKTSLKQSNGQQSGQELNLDPKGVASREFSELKVRFPAFEKHFDMPPAALPAGDSSGLKGKPFGRCQSRHRAENGSSFESAAQRWPGF